MPEVVGAKPRVEIKEKVKVEVHEDSEVDHKKSTAASAVAPMSWDAILVVLCYVAGVVSILSYSSNVALAVVFVSAVVAATLLLDSQMSMAVLVSVVAIAFTLSFVGAGASVVTDSL
jgi:hypothetical protein